MNILNILPWLCAKIIRDLVSNILIDLTIDDFLENDSLNVFLDYEIIIYGII